MGLARIKSPPDLKLHSRYDRVRRRDSIVPVAGQTHVQGELPLGQSPQSQLLGCNDFIKACIQVVMDLMCFRRNIVGDELINKHCF